MNWSATRPLGAIVAGCATVLLCACTMPAQDEFDGLRADAAAEVRRMQFIDDPEHDALQIARSHSADEVELLLADARTRNSERSDLYWGCAEELEGALAGAQFTAQAVGMDERWNDYVLKLDEDGTASLAMVGHAELVSDFAPGDFEVWLAQHVGELEGWSANLDELLAEHTLRQDIRNPYVASVGRCDVAFTLEFDVGEHTKSVAAYVQKGPERTLTLFLEGLPFDWGG